MPPAETKTLGDRGARLRRRRPAGPLLRQRPRRPTASSTTAATARFEEMTAETGAGVLGDQPRAGMGVAVGDPFGDGRDSLFVTNFGAEPNSLYRNVDGRALRGRGRGVGRRRARACRSCAGEPHFADFDNDGWPDLYAVGRAPRAAARAHARATTRAAARTTSTRAIAAYAQPTVLLHNLGEGRFDEWSDAGDLGRDCAWRARGTRRRGPRRRRRPRPRRRGPRRSGPRLPQRARRRGELDRDRAAPGRRRQDGARHAGAGHRERARRRRRRTASRRRTLSGSLVPLHFGLGPAARADAIEVRWPDGRTQVLRDVPAGKSYHLRPGGDLEAGLAR